MTGENKTKAQLLEELEKLRHRLTQLEAFEKKCKEENEAYQQSQANLAALIENAGDSIWSVNRDYRILTINSHFKKEFSAAFGIDLEIGTKITECVPSKLKKIWIDRYERAFQGENFSVEDVYDIGGKIINAEISLNPICNNGMITGVSVFARDVTERKKTEETLRESEERLKILFEYAPDAYYLSDLKGKFLDGNKMAERLTRYSKSELIGKSFLKLNLLPQDQIPRAAKLLIKNALGISTGPDEFILNRKDGSQVTVGITTHPVKIKDKILVLGIARDITENKLAERALRENEEKFRMLAEKSPNMIFINKKGRVVYANQKCTEVMGYRQDEFYSPDFDFLSMVSTESKDRVKDSYKKHMKGEDIAPYEYSLITKDRRKIDVILASKLIPYNGEEAILGIVTDITDRKEAEEALRKSEEKYRHLVENSNAVLFATDENGRLTYISPMIKPLIGYTPSEIEDRHFTELLYREDIDRFKQQFQKLAMGKSEPNEYRMLTKSRDICWIRTSSRSIFLNNRFLGIQGVMTDITDRKRAEEELKTSLREKEAVMREIHHRVKNNMQIVSSLLRLQSRNMRSKKLRETFRIAQNRIKSMALIHEVLYRSDNLEKVNFSEYIKKITNHLFSMSTQEAGRMKLDLDVGEIYLDIDRAIPCGLIINELLTNCLKHAFPDGQSGFVQIKLASKIDKFTIVVKDNGVGLPAETMPNSTETLGLQLVNDLVKQIEGSLKLQKEGGTTFQITF